MIDGFADEFFSANYSRVLYEDEKDSDAFASGNGLRVVETTLPEPLEPSALSSDTSAAPRHEGEEYVQPTEQVTYRRLEFMDSPLFTQTEVRMLPNDGVDHSRLSMAIHRFMASTVLHTFNNFSAPPSSSPPSSTPASFRVLLLGGGACSLPMHILTSSLVETRRSQKEAEMSIDVVEINQKILEMSPKFFGASFVTDEIMTSNNNTHNTQHGLYPYAMSAETFLRDRKATGDYYSVVVVDAAEHEREIESESNSPSSSSSSSFRSVQAPPSSFLHVPALLLSSVSPSGGLLVMNVLGGREWAKEVHARLIEFLPPLYHLSLSPLPHLSLTSLSPLSPPSSLSLSRSTHA